MIKLKENKLSLRELIGKPYVEGGRGPGNYDCWGIVKEVARRAGLELPDIEVPNCQEKRLMEIERQRKTNFRHEFFSKQWIWKRW